MGIDLVTHNPIGPSVSNDSHTHMPRDSQSNDINPSLFSSGSGSSSSSTSAQLLNKLASKLAPSLKKTQDLLSNNNKDVSTEVESSSPVSSSFDYPTTRRVSTSSILLNKMASRLNDTLKSILSRSTDEDYNNNYDINNDNYLQCCASASSLSEPPSDMSTSISTSNNGGGLVNDNNNNQDDDSNVSPLLDSLDLDLLKDYWHGISDGGVSSTSIDDTYDREPSMSLYFNKDEPRISGCESSEFQDLLHTCSGGDVNDGLLVTTTGTTTRSYDNEMAISTSHDVLEMEYSYKEHDFADGFSNFFIGDDSNMVNNSSTKESHFGGNEWDDRLVQEANSTIYYWNEDFSNFENYGVLPDSFLSSCNNS